MSDAGGGGGSTSVLDSAAGPDATLVVAGGGGGAGTVGIEGGGVVAGGAGGSNAHPDGAPGGSGTSLDGGGGKGAVNGGAGGAAGTGSINGGAGGAGTASGGGAGGYPGSGAQAGGGGGGGYPLGGGGGGSGAVTTDIGASGGGGAGDSFSSTAKICSVSGTKVTFKRAGHCGVIASQAGSSTYAAGHATQQIVVHKLSEHPTVTARSPKTGVLKVRLVSHPTVNGAKVTVYRYARHHNHKIGTAHTNRHGVATFKHKETPGKALHIRVKLAATATTLGARSGLKKVTIKGG
jgi:hypothetical protein